MTLAFYEDRNRTQLLMQFELDAKDGSLTVLLRESMHRLVLIEEEVNMLRGFLEVGKC